MKKLIKTLTLVATGLVVSVMVGRVNSRDSSGKAKVHNYKLGKPFFISK